MKYRLANLLEAESIATAGTKTIDLDTTDVISSIEIEAAGTNNGSVPTAHPAKMVSKIEVVDGSEVLYSLSGVESQAVSFFDEGNMPFNVFNYADAGTTRARFRVNFGRYLWDAQLGLDPNRYKNLQLKITHNKASGGSSPNAGTLSVWAKQFDEKKANPMGYLRSYEHFTYSLTSSAVKDVELPTEDIIRRIQVHSLAVGQSFTGQINRLKMSEDNDKRIPINNEYTRNLLKMPPNDVRIHEQLDVVGTGASQAVYVTPAYEGKATGLGQTANQASLISYPVAGGNIGCTFDSGETVSCSMQGFCPHGALAIAMGDANDMNDWYDAPKLKSLKLFLTAGSSVIASSTAEVVLQQLRRY
jgi:hypothetical protein